jgi:hypothetical protein
MNNLDQLSYYAKHQDEFPEKAPSEFLEWCLKEEDFPEQEKSWAQHELHIRKTGRTIIAVPKENEDGSPMKREDDGATIVDFAYTKGNTRTSNIPEILCFYPSAKSTHFALNKISELIRERSIPVPTGMPQIIEDPFETGIPCFYFLLEGEQRKYAQEHYVCQLDEDQDVIHLLIPAPNGDIQMQLVPEQIRPFGVEGRPMKASFWVEMIQTVEKELEDESNRKWGKSAELVEDAEIKELNADLIPFIDYSPRNGLQPGTEDWGFANMKLTLNVLQRTMVYLLAKQYLDFSNNKADVAYLTVSDAVEKAAQIIEPADSEVSSMIREFPRNALNTAMESFPENGSLFNIWENGNLCMMSEEDLANDIKDQPPSEELILPESELPMRFTKEGEIEVALNLSFSDGEFDTSKINLENLLRQCSQTDLMGEALEAVGMLLSNTFDRMSDIAKENKAEGKPVPNLVLSSSILCLDISVRIKKLIETEFDSEKFNSDYVSAFYRIIHHLGKDDSHNLFSICKDILWEIADQKSYSALYFGKELEGKTFEKKDFNTFRSCFSIRQSCYTIGNSISNIEKMMT